MPEMDGFDTTRAIRQLTAYETTPIIALTANAMTLKIMLVHWYA
jgi:hypothetical protein